MREMHRQVVNAAPGTRFTLRKSDGGGVVIAVAREEVRFRSPSAAQHHQARHNGPHMRLAAFAAGERAQR